MNINNKCEVNENNNKIEFKTLNNNNIEKNNLFNLKIFKQNNFEHSENPIKTKKYIISNRIGKYKFNGFKMNKGIKNFIKNEISNKGLITEANIDNNRDKIINNNAYINSTINSNKSKEKTKLFLNQKMDIHKLAGNKKLPLKFNLIELRNNYIIQKYFQKLKKIKEKVTKKILN